MGGLANTKQSPARKTSTAVFRARFCLRKCAARNTRRYTAEKPPQMMSVVAAAKPGMPAPNEYATRQ